MLLLIAPVFVWLGDYVLDHWARVFLLTSSKFNEVGSTGSVVADSGFRKFGRGDYCAAEAVRQAGEMMILFEQLVSDLLNRTDCSHSISSRTNFSFSPPWWRSTWSYSRRWPTSMSTSSRRVQPTVVQLIQRRDWTRTATRRVMVIRPTLKRRTRRTRLFDFNRLFSYLPFCLYSLPSNLYSHDLEACS